MKTHPNKIAFEQAWKTKIEEFQRLLHQSCVLSTDGFEHYLDGKKKLDEIHDIFCVLTENMSDNYAREMCDMTAKLKGIIK